MAVEDVGELSAQEAWCLVETGVRPWTCQRQEDRTEAIAHLGFSKGYGSWVNLSIAKGDGKYTVRAGPDLKKKGCSENSSQQFAHKFGA